MYNPRELAEKVEKEVCSNNSRKYYRFRSTNFYGGCATADCLGCNLRCVYCWAQKKVWNPKRIGRFYSPAEVCQKLLNFKQPLIRISGGEPTLCKNHLLLVIESLPKNALFILETNGILLDENYVKLMSNYDNLYVRVSLKGVDERSFEKITGAEGKYFANQLKALELLNKYKIEHRAAILVDLFNKEDIQKLNLPNLEYESLIKYPFVKNALKDRNII
ncbi:MAG: putative Fe-S oxidoreductase [Promethearchaeota archaeon]|nr:MAG: putative Fe-S oxidoreductase [Candidatus Lokiarchaeota archaeon]